VHDITHAKETDYFAGLERDGLVSELQWIRLDSTTSRKTTEYCAPSWSWAASKGKTSHLRGAVEEESVEDTFEILDAETFPVDDSYGQVSGGYIRMRGLICQVTFNELGDKVHAQGQDIGIKAESVVVNSRNHDLHEGNHSLNDIFWDGDTRDTLLSHDGFSFYFLPSRLAGDS
jgi:hypothetical protein